MIGIVKSVRRVLGVEPPSYLMRINPEVYEEERARVAARFEEAVRLAEEAFASELADLIDHLTDRLTPGPDGQRKVFRDSALGNFRDFIGRFRLLNVRSNPQLDALVEQAEHLLDGITPGQIRSLPETRQQLHTGMATLRQGLNDLVIDAPRRHIIRPGTSTNGDSHAAGD